MVAQSGAALRPGLDLFGPMPARVRPPVVARSECCGFHCMQLTATSQHRLP